MSHSVIEFAADGTPVATRWSLDDWSDLVASLERESGSVVAEIQTLRGRRVANVGPYLATEHAPGEYALVTRKRRES